MSSNFVTENELNTIKGLLHYLNENMQPTQCKVGVDIALTDSNGENLGKIEFNANGPGYVMSFG